MNKLIIITRSKIWRLPPYKLLSTKIDAKKPAKPSDPQDTKVRYNVCQDKPPTFQKLNIQKTLAPPKLSHELQELQPAMNSQIYTGPTGLPQTRANEAQAKQKTGAEPLKRYTHFMVSTTCKNVTLPLKMSKLAKPFPDPVKVMSSQIISDQDKADQMFAESRLAPVFGNY